VVGPRARCPVQPRSIDLDGIEALVVRREIADQCQPEYVVALDAQTVAVIIDDGAYPGNGTNETGAPYRPESEIAVIVQWLRGHLAEIELAHAGPPLQGNQ